MLKSIAFMKEGLIIKDFKIKELTKNNNRKISLFMTSLAEYDKVKEYLQKTKGSFFTFTPKTEKRKTFLLKGLSAKIDTNEIYNELLKFENDNLKFVKVNQFSNKKIDPK